MTCLRRGPQSLPKEGDRAGVVGVGEILNLVQDDGGACRWISRVVVGVGGDPSTGLRMVSGVALAEAGVVGLEMLTLRPVRRCSGQAGLGMMSGVVCSRLFGWFDVEVGEPVEERWQPPVAAAE